MSPAQRLANIEKCNAVRRKYHDRQIDENLKRACDSIAPGRDLITREELLGVTKELRKIGYARGHSAASNRGYRAMRKKQTELDAAISAKDLAYSERDKLVCALSKLFPSYLMQHLDGQDWEKDWRWIVCINVPAGQATGHIHDSELAWFNHLEIRENNWDGHDNTEKYQRLTSLQPRYVVTSAGTVDTAHEFVGCGIDSRFGSTA